MISDEYKKDSFKQDYSGKEKIEGVEIIELKDFSDDSGNFAEVVRLNGGKVDGVKGFEAKQVNWSFMLPEAVKATHYHLEQEDLFFVPPTDRLLIGLKDIREGSKTYDQIMRLTLGAGKAKILRVPKGVAHGMANLSDKPANIFYLVSNQFNSDPEKNDEHRLPPDIFGENFWEIEKA
ncbi:MAG: dTDP-4-dehydrorhamnose 3,5-epimerase family protein [bacterium]